MGPAGSSVLRGTLVYEARKLGSHTYIEIPARYPVVIVSGFVYDGFGPEGWPMPKKPEKPNSSQSSAPCHRVEFIV
jgi:hypothetical protein